MRQPLKSVFFFRRALLQSCLHNLRPDDGLSLAADRPGSPAACVTAVFDTRDEDTTFNRLVVEGSFEGAKLEVIVAACDSLEAIVEGRSERLDRYLADSAVPMQDKAALLRGLAHVRAVNSTDLLLHALTGRYVWVFVGIYPAGQCACRLDGMRLEFPRESFTQYFPEIYQQDEFFDRYIAVFQSLYLDIERKAEELVRLLDYQCAPDEQVAELAGWLGIDNENNLFSVDQLKSVIAQLELFQGAKGTRAALEAAVYLITGIRPRIVEYFQWSTLASSAARRRLNEQLYGGEPNDFCVILDLTRQKQQLAVSSAELDALIERYSVMGSSHRLVCLRYCSNIDAHCYLDVNSVLSTPRAVNIDGTALGDYITVG